MTFGLVDFSHRGESSIASRTRGRGDCTTRSLTASRAPVLAPLASRTHISFLGHRLPRCTDFMEISPRTAPAPLGAGNDCRERSGRQELKHRRCGGGGRRPGGVRRAMGPELEKTEGLRVGVTDVRVHGGDRGGGTPPSHLWCSSSLRSHSTPFGCSSSVPAEHRTPRQPHLAPSVLELRSSHLRCSNSVLSGRRSPERRSPNGDTPTEAVLPVITRIQQI